MAITTSLISYWKLDEQGSATRLDSHGTNHLGASGNTSAVQGKVRLINSATFGSGLSIGSATSGHLYHEDNASLSTGDIDFTIAGWVWLNQKGHSRIGLFGKWRTNNSQREYVVDYDNTIDRFRFLVSSDGVTPVATNASSFGSPPTGQWIHIIGWHDSVANTINIRVNGGSTDSQSHSAGVFNSTTAFRIGKANIANIDFFLNGKVDGVGFWKKVLTTAEQDEVYSDGFGKEYPWGFREDRRTIKPLGGGDYTTLHAWQSAEKRSITKSNVIALANVYPGGNAGSNAASLILSGWTTDRTRFVHIRGLPGSGHMGRGRPYSTVYPYIDYTGGDHTVSTQAQDTKIEDMQFLKTTGTGNFSAFTLDSSVVGNSCQVIADKCIFVLESTGSLGTLRMVGGGTSVEGGVAQNNIIKNSLILSRSTITTEGALRCVSSAGAGQTRLHHCTIINTGGGHAMATDAVGGHLVISRNCYLRRSGTGSCYSGLASNFQRGGADSTNNGEALHKKHRNIPYSTASFNNVTANQEDLHILYNASGLYRAGDNTTQQAFRTSIVEYLVLDDWEYELRSPASGLYTPPTGSGHKYDVGMDQIPYTTSAQIGGYFNSATFTDVSGKIGGYFDSAGHPVPQVYVGGYQLAKAIFDNQKVGFLGGYSKCDSANPMALMGGYVLAMEFGDPSGYLGGYIEGRHVPGTSTVGGYMMAYPDCKEFIETHSRSLVKVMSNNIVDQDLNIDCVVTFKGKSNKDFSGRFMWYASAAAEFNARFKVENYKKPPIVQILSVSPSSGIMGPDGCRKVTVVASGTLKDGKEWINAYIDFGEPFEEINPRTFTTNMSISGFSGPPPWTAFHDYCVSGKYVVTARGQDNLGMVGMDAFRLNLASGLPSNIFPQINISGIPRFGKVPDAVRVDFTTQSTGTIPDKIVNKPSDRRILWNLGNRETTQRTEPFTYYQSPGTFTPTIRMLYTTPSGKKLWVSDTLMVGYNR